MRVNVRINRTNHVERIFDDMVNYSFESECLSDLMFICSGGSRRHAHQSVLSHISPLINSMKNPDEKMYISLDSVKVDILDCLLRFLYTGQVVVSDSQKITLLSDLCKSLKISLSNTTKLPIPSTTVYCICRQPEKSRMIGCDYCDEWYHIKCINVSRSEVKVLKQQFWKCPVCVSSGKKDKYVFPIKYYDDSSMSSSSSDHSDELSQVGDNKGSNNTNTIPTYINNFKDGSSSSSDEKSSSPKPHCKKRKYKDGSILQSHKENNSFVNKEIVHNVTDDRIPLSNEEKASTSQKLTSDEAKIQISSHKNKIIDTIDFEIIETPDSGIPTSELNELISQQMYIKTETNKELEGYDSENVSTMSEGELRPTPKVKDTTVLRIFNKPTPESQSNQLTTRINQRNIHIPYLKKNVDISNSIKIIPPVSKIDVGKLNHVTVQQSPLNSSTSDQCSLLSSIYLGPNTSSYFNDKSTTSNLISPHQYTHEASSKIDENSKSYKKDPKKEYSRRPSNDDPSKGNVKIPRKSTEEDLSFCYTCLSIFVTRKALREHEVEHH
ncbi:uncharacterized protein [Lepeophtheirus salmonis]|uniref:uncharacterized protein isoform X1 n=1 Tax=Lepeophtheirus salmonis TaxID=72036 RepID=UPI001AE58594|nr:uncharacterized protein LOC121129101 isoform X1 [Lepeophtheirus salmonis]